VVNLIFLSVLGNIQRNNQALLIVISTPKHSALTFIKGKKAVILADKAFLVSRKEMGFRVNNYWSSCGIQDTLKVDLLEKYNFSNNMVNVISRDSVAVIVWKDKTFLWIGKNLKNRDLEVKNASFDYLILANKSVKDLKQIIGKVQFKNLIIDGSNTRWYADKLATQAEELGLKYYDLNRSGALKIE
jgi:hypothetical protein